MARDRRAKARAVAFASGPLCQAPDGSRVRGNDDDWTPPVRPRRRHSSDALHRIAVASQSIGIAAVLIHAKDDAAKRFTLSCAEFIEYPADSRTLFLPIETVIAAFG